MVNRNDPYPGRAMAPVNTERSKVGTYLAIASTHDKKAVRQPRRQGRTSSEWRHVARLPLQWLRIGSRMSAVLLEGAGRKASVIVAMLRDPLQTEQERPRLVRKLSNVRGTIRLEPYNCTEMISESWRSRSRAAPRFAARTGYSDNDLRAGIQRKMAPVP